LLLRHPSHRLRLYRGDKVLQGLRDPWEDLWDRVLVSLEQDLARYVPHSPLYVMERMCADCVRR